MKLKQKIAGLALCLAASQSYSEMISVEITNLSHGSYFTPLLVTAHNAQTHLFEVGTIASTALQEMAEGGSIASLVTIADGVSAVSAQNPAEGFLNPGSSTVVNNMDTGTNAYLSITAMVLPSNDGFVGLDAWPIPSTAGTYTVMLNAYDAGTEANNELLVEGSGAAGMLGIPGNPGMNGGTNGTGVTTSESNAMVHIHRGVLGDTQSDGGSSDLDSRIHRWLNPIAKVVITVQ